MSTGAARLGRTSAAFGAAAAITALFNLALALVKDYYHPLANLMNELTGNNWTTQGLADVILFVGLGLILSRTHAAEKLQPNQLISLLAASVIIAGAGLFAWYLVF